MSEKLSITLPPDMVATIEAEVASGRYASTSEMVSDAMHAWLRREEQRAEQIASVRARIEKSLDDPRPPVDMDEAFTRIRAHAASLRHGR